MQTSEFSAWVDNTVRQPDGRIKKGSGSLVGNNVYNTISFGISIQNDGTATDAFKVTVSGTTPTGYLVTYFHGTTNITSSVVAGTYVTPSIAAGSAFLIKAKVKVESGAAGGSSVSRLVTLTSAASGSKVDAVKFTVSRS